MTSRLHEARAYELVAAIAERHGLDVAAIADTSRRDRRISAARREVIAAILGLGRGIRETAWLLDVDPGTVMHAKRKGAGT